MDVCVVQNSLHTNQRRLQSSVRLWAACSYKRFTFSFNIFLPCSFLLQFLFCHWALARFDTLFAWGRHPLIGLSMADWQFFPSLIHQREPFHHLIGCSLDISRCRKNTARMLNFSHVIHQSIHGSWDKVFGVLLIFRGSCNTHSYSVGFGSRS